MNKTGSCFDDIRRISNYLEATFNPFLMSDLIDSLESGTCYHRATDTDYDGIHTRYMVDESKLILLYAQIHQIANLYPKKSIVFDFYDDRGRSSKHELDIIKNLFCFFSEYPHLLPAKLTLRLALYRGHEAFFYTDIQGTGMIDSQYAVTVQDMIDQSICKDPELFESENYIQAVLHVNPEYLFQRKALGTIDPKKNYLPLTFFQPATSLSSHFKHYPPTIAPFLHEQLKQWTQTKPFERLKVLHHVPLLPNTLLKIACLIAGGATVTVTHPHAITKANPDVIACLKQEGIRYIEDLSTLRREAFDIYFDYEAELYLSLGAPVIGAIELTAFGDSCYRHELIDFPVVSVYQSMTQQIKAILGDKEQAMKYIDPLYYSHNIAALQLLDEQLQPGLHAFSSETDQRIVVQWCIFHDTPLTCLEPFLIRQEQFAEQNRFDMV